MKIQHRIIAIGAVSTIAVLVAGCSGGGGTSPSSSGGELSGTVTGIFDAQYKGAVEPIVKAFEEKNPGVTVKFDYQGGDLGPAILAQLQAGTAPDVLLTFPGGSPNDSSDNVVPLANAGLIAPFEADWSGDVPETWKPQVFFKDQLYAFPGALQPLAAMYNQTLLDELGLKVPTTLDEVMQLCTDAKAKGVYAFAQGLGETAAGPQMLSFGQTASLIYGADPTWDQGLATGKVSYPGSGWQTQFEIYQKMFDAGCFGEGSLGRSRQQGQDAVAQRQALGLVDVGAVLAGIHAANKDDKFVVAAIPATNDGKNSITALPGYTLTVNAAAKNLDAAKAFVAFAGEPEQSAAFATGFGSVPLIPNTKFTPPAELKEFNTLVVNGQTAPIASLQPEVQSTLNTAVQSMLLGNDTPASAAQKMQDAYKK
ncbi:ABC transporter substrate-binding protein [Microbacterium deminutum]|uniref:Extracellular solute-binding protein n=1 Tax=Microbacterium deminutum TaxID=344164 RepID=A0ABN2Q571_9MICO